MEIKKVELSDLKELEELIKEEFAYAKLTFASLEKRFKKENVFLFKAVENKTILASLDLELANSRGKIVGLLVKKPFRQKKIGLRLTKFAINFFKNNKVNEINLIVKARNLKAKKLYKKLGFKSIGFLDKKIENCLVEKFSLELKKETLAYIS